MKKLLYWYDTYFLKILVAFLILFTALYPKLPSVHIIRTWVYIRLEDFFILFGAIIWFIQWIRKKVTVPFWLLGIIGSYWVIGLISTLYSIFFIGPHLANYFPHIALLEDARRIEYMILFFIAFSTIKSTKDVRDYFIILCLTIFGVVLYGFGQRYYLDLWTAFPKFFEKYSFCFPSFQTGNEEFAKGIPLCLPQGARITSTFGGHYDLAAYLVFVLPIIFTVFIAIKKWYWKFLTSLLFIFGLVLLIFTSSRTSFVAYIFAVVTALIFYKKKWYIAPVIIVSILVLLIFSQATAKRFLETFRISSVVTNSQGQLIGETTGALPSDLANKISKNSVILEKPPPAQNLQTGSAFINLPGQSVPVATSVAVVSQTVSAQEAEKLKLANGSLQISTVSGNFLVHKALVYDISFTTRFQAEWPNAWNAFLRNPLLGSGYSSITLATDNDYLRALGETGILGFISFFLIFLVLGILLRERSGSITSPLAKAWVFGAAGGVIGLALNATLIDVFESSKVAEGMWLLLGIGAGSLSVYQQKTIDYFAKLKTVLTSNIFLSIYLICLSGAAFLGSIGNFFVADDFTWLRWAASSTTNDIKNYFLNSSNFFYRPLDKTIIYFLYNFLSFQPQGYHIYIIILHVIVILGVFFLVKQITDKKLLAFLTATLFMLLPIHAESIYWLSSISIVLSTVFIIYLLICFVHFRRTGSIISYILAVILFIMALLTYEISVILPLLVIATDIYIIHPRWKMAKTYLAYLPLLILLPVYFVIRQTAHAFSGGGDYRYSLPHLIPNVFGNLFGYIGLFLGGEQFLPIYNTLRTSLREKPLLFLLIIILICIIIVSFYSLTKTILQWQNNKSINVIVFGLVFAIIALLPFLGLGNIAERYIYLASFGLCLALIIILEKLVDLAVKTVAGGLKTKKKQKVMIPKWFNTVSSKVVRKLILFTIVILLAIWYQIQNIAAQKMWQQAGLVTQSMLTTFRINYEGLTPNDSIYFINVPLKKDNAWIYPVGLTDAMWFIYREQLPHIYQVTSLEQAEEADQKQNPQHVYIFSFDKNGKMTRAE